MVMSAEKANDPEPESHPGLQRLAVIGLGRTATAKLLPPVVELTPDGPVALLLQAIDTVRTTKLRTATSLFTVSLPAARVETATA
jgi:hypothetical protein